MGHADRASRPGAVQVVPSGSTLSNGWSLPCLIPNSAICGDWQGTSLYAPQPLHLMTMSRKREMGVNVSERSSYSQTIPSLGSRPGARMSRHRTADERSRPVGGTSHGERTGTSGDMDFARTDVPLADDAHLDLRHGTDCALWHFCRDVTSVTAVTYIP